MEKFGNTRIPFDRSIAPKKYAAAAPGVFSVTGWQLTVLLCEGTECRLQFAMSNMLTNRREMSRGWAKMLTF